MIDASDRLEQDLIVAGYRTRRHPRTGHLSVLAEPGVDLRAFWIAALARSLGSGNRLAFYIALGQLGTVRARQR